MNRRAYLATVAGLGAGCVGTATGPAGGEQIVSVSNVERRTPADPERLDADERPTALEIAVEVVDPTITDESTARLALAYSNTGSDTLELNINPELPDPLPSVADDPGLLLLSDGTGATRMDRDCWKPAQDRFPVPAVVYQYPLEPGERATMAYDVWADPLQTADCIQSGTYSVEPLSGSFVLSVSET